MLARSANPTRLWRYRPILLVTGSHVCGIVGKLCGSHPFRHCCPLPALRVADWRTFKNSSSIKMFCADFKWPSLLSCRQYCLPSARLSNSRRPNDINPTPALPDQASTLTDIISRIFAVAPLCLFSCCCDASNSIVYSSSDTASVPTRPWRATFTSSLVSRAGKLMVAR